MFRADVFQTSTGTASRRPRGSYRCAAMHSNGVYAVMVLPNRRALSRICPAATNPKLKLRLTRSDEMQTAVEPCAESLFARNATRSVSVLTREQHHQRRVLVLFRENRAHWTNYRVLWSDIRASPSCRKSLYRRSETGLLSRRENTEIRTNKFVRKHIRMRTFWFRREFQLLGPPPVAAAPVIKYVDSRLG